MLLAACLYVKHHQEDGAQCRVDTFRSNATGSPRHAANGDDTRAPFCSPREWRPLGFFNIFVLLSMMLMMIIPGRDDEP